MLELRFGSYSIEATFAGTPTLSRRKATWRYCFLWPPPRCHTTISPWLLRPPERFFGSSKDFSGVSLVMWLLSRTVINRRDAVYGLKLFSPIASLPLTFLRRCNFPCGAPSNYCSYLLSRLQLHRARFPETLAFEYSAYRFSAYSIIFSPSASFT